jgi:pimeloyl-ACP methyl ester carboxylesterase
MDMEDEAGVLSPTATEGIRVVRYDARGHGRSEATDEDDDYQWSSLAMDMLGVLDGLGAPTAVLGGASMGSATALHAAVVAPDRVDGLVLMIPPTAWAGRRAQARLYGAGASMVSTGGMAPFIAMGRAAAAPKILQGELASVQDAMFRAMEALDSDVVAHILRGAARSDLPAQEALAALGMPALILAWTGDPGHPVATADELARLLPAAELHVASEPDDVRRWPSMVAEFVRDL